MGTDFVSETVLILLSMPVPDAVVDCCSVLTVAVGTCVDGDRYAEATVYCIGLKRVV